MELPFAVEPAIDPVTSSQLQESTSSTLINAPSDVSSPDSRHLDGLNTPQDVFVPRYKNEKQPEIGTRVFNSEANDPNDGFVDPEITDFTYVNVSETDADGLHAIIDDHDLNFEAESQRSDVLSLLLSGTNPIVDITEEANEAASNALEAKKRGDLLGALEYHTLAARKYKENAINNPSFARPMLLLSQTQAKSAIALKKIIQLNPEELIQALHTSDDSLKNTPTAISHKDRLRAAVRGALGSKNHEADISDSQFLGRATTNPGNYEETKYNEVEIETSSPAGADANHNPVDDMMELERELRDMDMALELGSSISSLDTRMQNRMKSSVVDGSFMVVPPGSNSYMSSSMWGGGPTPRSSAPQTTTATANVRARANRVQSVMGASTASPAARVSKPVVPPPTTSTDATDGLESSWWGNSNTTSQMLASSVISLGTRVDSGPSIDGGQPANTKQLMRLMDSLKTLGDENAELIRQVEDAEASRMEAKAAREQMKRFKYEYGKRFASLKAALDKFRQDHPERGSTGSDHPMNSSEFIRSSSTKDQIQRQEQLIRKLTADLKKEKEESKKKDAALRKYEAFYREVKARSAQKKTAQRKTESQRTKRKT
mmetsp:Transcript_1113/g.2206  ORF Transcript_1113/g.2206 Transcript_1113/m.2206 type:complete len:604 (+) Transcript_1113:1816-3627(+)